MAIDPASAEILLRAMFAAAIEAAQPAICVPPHLPEDRGGRLIVIGAGKASAAMAAAVEAHWHGPLSGVVATRYGYGASCEKIEIIESAHPVPDENSLRAAERMLAAVSNLSARDQVLCLLSGGASSLLCLPGAGLTLDDKRAINRALLASGAPIQAMNCVRRHLSAIKGGRLAAAAHPARVLTLAMSDVPGDGLSDIGSGPTIADATTCADALAIARQYAIPLPPAALHLLLSNAGESVKPDDARLARADARVIVTPAMALDNAARVARYAGIRPVILGDRIEGEAREVGAEMAAIARAARENGTPCVILSGGETTVTVRGDGVGGRNVEFLLSLAINLDGAAGIYALAGDTDGADGAIDVAGAVIAPDTLAKARAVGLSPRDALDRNDAHTFFEKIGAQIVTGPTRTNVNDFRAIVVTGG